MLPQPLSYSNFCYIYALFKLYIILLSDAKAKITKDRISGNESRASPDPRCGFAYAQLYASWNVHSSTKERRIFTTKSTNFIIYTSIGSMRQQLIC